MPTMKPGDWNCPECGDLQFARNAECRKCGAPNPDPEGSQAILAEKGISPTARGGGAARGGGGNGQGEKPGDWYCMACGDHQFARNATCRKCGAPNPSTGPGAMFMMGMKGAKGMAQMGFGMGGSSGKGGSSNGQQMKQGDWNCSSCGDLQFARNAECRKCGAPKPGNAGHATPKNVKPGDWNCPSCGDLQFAKNEVCRKCDTPNPDPEGSREAMEAGIASGFGGNVEKPGDWYCPGCGDLQFKRNKVCRQCQTPNPDPQEDDAPARRKPAVQEKPGDWHCSSCGDLQFARNASCRKCGTPNYGDMGGGMWGGCGADGWGGKGGYGWGGKAKGKGKGKDDMWNMFGMMMNMKGMMGGKGGKGRYGPY